MAQIITNCKENLNVFVKDFLSIMQRIVSNNNFNNDVTVVELVEKTYCNICQNVDGALFSGDSEFVKMYQAFVTIYFKVVNDSLHNDDLVLKGCIDISQTKNIASSPQIKHLIPESVHCVLVKFVERNPRYKLPHLDPSGDQNLGKRLSRTQTRTLGLDDIQDTEADLSVRALKSYFGTTETDKLSASIRSLSDFIQTTPNKDLLEFICNGIPVQLRYIVVLLLIRQLNIKTSKHIIILKLVSSLLVSDVSIVGLSILDMMRKILKFQMENISQFDIVEQCSLTLADLNNKIYYRGQTSDMLYELIVKLKSTKNTNEISVLNGDVKQLLKQIVSPCLSLELFLDLAPFAAENEIVSLFDAVEDQTSGGWLFSRLFELIRKLKSSDHQRSLMHKVFEKYKNLALLSGLKYFTESVAESEPAYYIYHIEAARYLDIDDYRSQTEYKRETNSIFTKEDLVNFYSDVGSNKYSKKGMQILLSQNMQMSNSDLLSDTNGRSTIVGSLEGVTQDSSSEAIRSQNQEMNGNKKSNGTALHDYKMDNSISLGPNNKSWGTYRFQTPKVADLKRAMSRKGQQNVKRESSLRGGSQSVKSRVTNITFLLSELKSLDDETSHIHDPDEDEIVGMDKPDLVKSHALKPSISVSGSNRKSFVKPTERSQDEFTDAVEEVPTTGTRGRLF